MKNIAIVATKVSILLLEAGCVCQVSFVYGIVTNHEKWHREHLRRDNERKNRENTGNLKIQFEWDREAILRRLLDTSRVELKGIRR